MIRQYVFAGATGAIVTTQILVPGRARLVSVDWSLAMNPSGDDDGAAQLSMRSEITPVPVGSGVVESQVISDINVLANEVTAVGYNSVNLAKNHPVNVPVDSQQVIYLHVSAGTGTLLVSVGLSYIRE